MGYLTFITLLAFLMLIPKSADSLCRYPSTSRYGATSDYYVGEMSLIDAMKGRKKRRAIYPWRLSHSMILFRGVVFEWGINKSYLMSRNPGSCQITWRRSRENWSKCTLYDAVTWTRRYGRANTYNILTNNCHMYVNRLAKYLYNDCGR